jgi:hypothetical protein
MEGYLFYPQNDSTRLFGAEEEFPDPFQQTVTDVFTPTVTALDSQAPTMTLSVVVTLPSGSYRVRVAAIANIDTALYLSLPDQQGRLKTSKVPFCYVRAMSWGQGNRSFSAAIDYTAPDQITWV